MGGDMSSTIAFIQARMSSSRFPGKVLAELGGLPMIAFMVRRLRAARTLDEVVVVTSTDPSDDPLAAALSRHGVKHFRGDLNDVLQRYAAAAREYGAREVLRLTGDCPLIDPWIVDAVVESRRTSAADYASNIDPPTFPDGMDVEVFTREVLERAVREAREPSEREHVTLWMRADRAGLRRQNLVAISDLSSLRLTVDYPDDLAVVREIVGLAATRTTGDPDLYDILRCLALRPGIAEMNKHARNEGLAASLAAQQSRSEP
jgi:spore coat polysaccharide biosynthesis protein SpsF